MLLATRCPVCTARGPVPCAPCARSLVRAPALPAPPGLDSFGALLAYDGGGRSLIVALKYRGAHRLARRLGASAAVLVGASTVDVVTWAPATHAGRRRRGYDQGQLLAKAVARALGVPCRRLLTRVSGRSQTGAPAVARRGGPGLRARRAPAAPRCVCWSSTMSSPRAPRCPPRPPFCVTPGL